MPFLAGSGRAVLSPRYRDQAKVGYGRVWYGLPLRVQVPKYEAYAPNHIYDGNTAAIYTSHLCTLDPWGTGRS